MDFQYGITEKQLIDFSVNLFVETIRFTNNFHPVGRVVNAIWQGYDVYQALDESKSVDEAMQVLIDEIGDQRMDAKMGQLGRAIDKAAPGRSQKLKPKEGSGKKAAKDSDDIYDAATNRLKVLNSTCFVAGTPILTADGYRPIEDLQPGDSVWSRCEDDATSLPVLRAIERTFELSAPVIELHIGGQVIETTPEHPFYVSEIGWCRAMELRQGDRLVGYEGSPTPITQVLLSDRIATVYNLRIHEDHTYFVGRPDWGFSVWVHNAYTARQAADGTWEVIDDAGTVVRKGLQSQDDALAQIMRRKRGQD